LLDGLASARLSDARTAPGADDVRRTLETAEIALRQILLWIRAFSSTDRPAGLALGAPNAQHRPASFG